MEENEGKTAVIEECDYRNKIYQIQVDGLHWACQLPLTEVSGLQTLI